MHFLSKLKNNSILLIPHNIRDKVLDYIDRNNLLLSVKLMSFADLKKGLLYDYNNEAIYEVMKQFNINYNIALNYIKDSFYYDGRDNEKMNLLKNVKDFLEEKNLLIYDNLFTSLLKSKKTLYVYGFDYINKFNKYLLDEANKYIEVQIIEKEENDYKHKVFELDTINDEITFVAENISRLVKEGVSFNKIFIANYNDEYYFTMRRIFKAYNIPYNLKKESSLYDTLMGSYLLNNLEGNKELILYNLRKEFNIKPEDNNIVYNKIVNLINSYYWCEDLINIKEMIKEEMKKIYLDSNHYKEEIKTTSILDNVFNDDEYVFLIGFNLNSVPILKRDEDFISDSIKPSFLETSYEYNNIIKDLYRKIIRNIKNITITYKLSSSFNLYYPSFLIDGDYIIKEKVNLTISNHSSIINKYRLGISIDNLIKFNESSEYLEILNSNYSIPYKTYDNKWLGIDNKELLESIDNKLNFSYSNISKYYECPFKFYVNKILKVYSFEETFDLFIGNLFHHVLEICLKDKEADIDNVYDEYIENYTFPLTNANRFFLKLLKKEIHFVINTIKEQYLHSSHNEEWNEKEIEIEKTRKIKTKVKGVVDKLLLLNNKAIIIDYKTGKSDTIDPDLFAFGLSLQLPIYLYLLKELDSNIEVAGLYLQHILNLDVDYNPNKDFIDEKKKNLKLSGLTIKDETLIAIFDDTYESSDIISGLKILKNGDFGKSKNLLSVEKKVELINLVERLIDNCIDMVSDGDFEIKPIKIPKKADGCSYCEYKDICYRQYKDFNIQEIISKGDDDNE